MKGTFNFSIFVTIRNLFATSMGENAVHGSDSDENAEIEGSFHFSKEEILS